MQTEYGKNSNIIPKDFPGIFESVAITGFVIVIASTFLDFTPVVALNWRAGGIGLPVMLACIAGTVFMLFRNYFAGFFIAVFSGFFLTHEIIIIYDNKAVELGRELGTDGWFRLVFDVYRDAFSFNTGAFWALVGVLLAAIGICAGWVLNIIRMNNEAVQLSQLAADTDKPTADAIMAATDSEENASASSGAESEDGEVEWSDEDSDAVDDASEEDDIDSDQDARA